MVIGDYINYRISKAEEAYVAASILYEAGQWNAVVNRLYYACFYIASALLMQRSIGAKSHAGVLSKFSQTAVRTGEITADDYKVYAKLLNWRSKGDYSDMFDFTKEDVDDVFLPVRQFLDKVKAIIHSL